MKRSLAALSLLAVLAIASAAHADDPAVTEAQKRFQEGLVLADAGKHDEARLKFQQALSAFGTPAVFYNLARAEQLTGHDFEALTHYKSFLRMGEIDPKITDAMRERARANIAELNKKAGQIELTAPTTAKITIDGQLVDAASFELVPVPPGHHTVEATWEGRVKSVPVDCTAGTITKVTIEFGAPGTDGAAQPKPGYPTTETTSSARYIVSGSLAAAGVIGLGLGIGFAVSSQSAKDKEDSLRTPGRCADPNSAGCTDLKDARDSVDSRATISTVGYIAGGVLVAGAAVSFFFWPKSETRAGFAPLPGGGAFSLQGAF